MGYMSVQEKKRPLSNMCHVAEQSSAFRKPHIKGSVIIIHSAGRKQRQAAFLMVWLFPRLASLSTCIL